MTPAPAWSPDPLERRLQKLRYLRALKAQAGTDRRYEGYRDDPVRFCTEVLGDRLWAKQEEILRALWRDRRVVVSACYASGKTHVAARAVMAWVATDPEAIAITTATVGRQVGKQLWGEIRKAAQRSPLPGQMIPAPDAILPSGPDLPGEILPKAPEWHIAPGNFAVGFSTKDPSAFAGWHSGRVLVVLDEAEGIPEPIWEQMEGQLATADTAVLAGGNPINARGGFWRAATSRLWTHIPISAFETPNLVAGRDDVAPYLISGRWVQERRIEWGEEHPLWVSKVLGQFPEGGGDRLVIPLSWFERAVDRLGPVDVSGEEPEAGLDPARFGADWTGLVIRQGPLVLHIERIHGADGVQVSGWALERMARYGCRVVKGDSGGLGGPILDIMRWAPGIRVVDVNAGEKPEDPEKFVRLRDELWWGLRLRFEHDQVVLGRKLGEANLSLLKAEVTAPFYGFDAMGRIKVESKDEMARRELPSPDLADACCLAFHRPAPVRRLRFRP